MKIIMMNLYYRFFILPVLVLMLCGCSDNVVSIDVSGDWKFRTDASDVGISEKWYLSDFENDIHLPGTLDDAGVGTPNPYLPTFEAPQIRHLIRKNSYIGPAWYTKMVEIDENMAGRELGLSLERVIWESQLWVDDIYCGIQESLSVPHRFTLPPLEAGKHKITLRIDNRAQYDISVVNMGHCYTDDTQIIWNGVLGDMSIVPIPEIDILEMNLFPDYDTRTVLVKGKLHSDIQQTAQIRFCVPTDGKGYLVTHDFVEGINEIVYSYKMSDAILWDEFSPVLYEMTMLVNGGMDSVTETFGFRKVENKDGALFMNGRPLFLRGTLESCVFPLTGTPPVDYESWEEIFRIVKSYGLNHLRFHSWCPPEAAFDVADNMGLYLQIELPWWSYSVGHDRPTNDFMWAEALYVMNEYGNHPSFCFWSMGNELEGDIDMLQNFVKVLKEQDDRRLYTTTSFTFQRGAGSVSLPCDDYLVTQWTDRGWVRGQGIFNDYSPSFASDYHDAIADTPVPVVAHEVGQYCIYPRMDEIEKYTGVLLPLNMIAVRNDLEKKNLLHKADEYVEASGKLATVLYKEEIERYLKTDRFGGFQLLDLHDYPGQGTALVGILDAFWDSKGLITPKEWRGFCCEVVPLIDYSKATFNASESFDATVSVANYWNKTIENAVIEWEMEGLSWNKEGCSEAMDLPVGLSKNVFSVSVPLDEISEAQAVTVRVRIKGTCYQNKWNIWVYPETDYVNGDILVTRNTEEAKTALRLGKKVLFNPDWRYVNGIEGMFLPVFWSPVHFPNQAGTMGVLCNPEHPAFAHFPTEMHTDWQWWDIVKNSRTMVLDSIPQVTPLIEVVDNFLKNRRLSMAFEANVGSGKLLMVSTDIVSDLQNRPVARQLKNSLLIYMNSENFDPQGDISEDVLDEYITSVADETQSSSTRVYNY